MTRVGLVYFTKTDATGRLAASVKKGILCVDGVQVYEHQILGNEIIEGRFENHTVLEELCQCDAIIFGSPTYMGNVAAQFKSLADASSELWCEQKWAGKIAAGFTCGSAPNGDQSSTLQYLVTLANQHGMVWVGLDSAYGYEDRGVNRMGNQLGLTAHVKDGKEDDMDHATAEYLGCRVATMTNRLCAENSLSLSI